MAQKQQLENIKEKNVHSVSIFGMKFAVIYYSWQQHYWKTDLNYLTIISFMMIQNLIYDDAHLKLLEITKIIH